jgi:hypothetical protein
MNKKGTSNLDIIIAVLLLIATIATIICKFSLVAPRQRRLKHHCSAFFNLFFPLRSLGYLQEFHFVANFKKAKKSSLFLPIEESLK